MPFQKVQKIKELQKDNSELNLMLWEMFYYGLDLVERVRMEPVEVHILRVESLTSDKKHADGLRLIKKGVIDG